MHSMGNSIVGVVGLRNGIVVKEHLSDIVLLERMESVGDCTPWRLGMMPEGEDGRLRPRAERSVVHILASTDEPCGFGNVSGYCSFRGTVVDHDKGAA